VLERYARNTKGIRLEMKKISFWTIGGTKKLKVEGLEYNVRENQRHQKIHRKHCKH
jgi:hypothetical protein